MQRPSSEWAYKSQVPTSRGTADTASIVTCALLEDGAWIEATGLFL
jgi:hypothetical protein